MNLQQNRKMHLTMCVNYKQSDFFNLQKITFFVFIQLLVNTKTTFPLRVGEQRSIFTSTLRFLVCTIHLPFAG